MKPISISSSLLLSFQISSIASLLVLPDLSFQSIKKAYQGLQKPIMPLDVPGILMPGSSGEGSKVGADDLSISDVIGKERIINIFAGFTRRFTKSQITCSY